MDNTRTTPLHPQSDGMVKRFNRTMEEQLSKIMDSHQQDWDEYPTLFLMAYRPSVHDTTNLIVKASRVIDQLLEVHDLLENESVC